MSGNSHKEVEINNYKPLPGFFRRLVAQITDTLLFWIVTLLVLLPFYIFSDLTVLKVLVSMVGVIEHPLYDEKISYIGFSYSFLIIIFWIKYSTTPGKRLLRMKIVDFKTQGIPTKKQFIFRSFGYLVSTIPLCMGFVWILFDKNNRAWHDHLSGTQVVFIKCID
jgi:uncharacterized RDD family membrane protein YckC